MNYEDGQTGGTQILNVYHTALCIHAVERKEIERWDSERKKDIKETEDMDHETYVRLPVIYALGASAAASSAAASSLSAGLSAESCMSEVQRVKLSRSNCMINVESL